MLIQPSVRLHWCRECGCYATEDAGHDCDDQIARRRNLARFGPTRFEHRRANKVAWEAAFRAERRAS